MMEKATKNISETTHVNQPSNEKNRNSSIRKSNNVLAIEVNDNEQDLDPYSMFEVENQICDILYIRIIEGRNITKGSVSDFLDTPDPFVEVKIKEASDAVKRTTCISNEVNPKWNETLKFFLPHANNSPTIAKLQLMDANYTIDEKIDIVEFDLNEVSVGDTIEKTFIFKNNAEVVIEFKREINHDYNLRYSLTLCNDEKEFRAKRRLQVHSKLKDLLKENAPVNLRDTPTIAIMGSGGGYRALVGFSGAIKGLEEIGVFDCATYAVGLSGSTWFLSSLYSHKSFPEQGMNEAIKETRHNMSRNFLTFLKPSSIYRYIKNIKNKRQSGQPVTFTDFFGLLVGEHLLGSERMDEARLSDFSVKVKDASIPLPIMTCLHVQPDVSAMVYHEWMEFTPYEIGMAKYGVFVRTSDFNNKFFMGVISKYYPEAPLHFLMGVWGSAFSILFNRLVVKNDKSAEQENKKDLEANFTKLRNSNFTGNKPDDEESDEEDNLTDLDLSEHENEKKAIEKAEKEKPSIIQSIKNFFGFGPKPAEVTEEDEKSNSFSNYIINSLMKTKFFASREYRAGKILNFMRGLETSCVYPISPFTENKSHPEEKTFSQLNKTISGKKKKVFIVDAGLTFNSPYPAILRPQRAVNLILSFDFSAREADNSNPFAELLLAEKWARIHHIPFPKIREDIFEKEGLKELYVFKDEDDINSPIILHFCLCNVQFRKFSAPGVKRVDDDTSGDFDIFEEETPYSTFDFHYKEEEFTKLHELIKFNTLLNKHEILEAIKDCVRLKKKEKVFNRIKANGH